MNIPVLDFKMENGEFPTCEYVEHPAGCNGYSIVNNEYLKGSFTISIGDNVVYESGEYVNKESGVRLKVRGNTSSYDGVLKKSYKVKLSKKADLLLREDKKLKDKDWVLLGLGSKKLNYVAGTETGRICGIPWEPEGRHVVVIINDQYMGTYYLVEAISAGSHRVDIAESGYIVENDAYWWKPEEVYFKSIHQRYDLGWTFKEPDTDDFHEMSLENVKWAINNIEHHLYNGKDVTDFIDYESFANWLLAHDIIMTTDGYGSNIFVTKADFDPLSPYSTKFKMGPLWDFDTSLTMNVKEHTPITTLPGFWYHLLTKDPVFEELY
ncbi:MAG: CotH kinase family protein, partial [Muribaculaceae bacterium]|nr:CotH kinase family protein [Muribaculaceae bacterium]